MYILLNSEDILHVVPQGSDFSPFQSKIHVLAFMLVNSPRPMVILIKIQSMYIVLLCHFHIIGRNKSKVHFLHFASAWLLCAKYFWCKADEHTWTNSANTGALYTCTCMSITVLVHVSSRFMNWFQSYSLTSVFHSIWTSFLCEFSEEHLKEMHGKPYYCI